MQSLATHGIPLIDMVVVNLYRSKKWLPRRKACRCPELIENIDIGGPTLIRAAAKNYQDVAVVVSPDDYPAILEELHERHGELASPRCGDWRRKLSR
jgi:phosphoribosylaminoimidazolecarboxamide formyltransferase/IMP cyclohydrolase